MRPAGVLPMGPGTHLPALVGPERNHTRGHRDGTGLAERSGIDKVAETVALVMPAAASLAGIWALGTVLVGS